MHQVADQVWALYYPLKVLGTRHGRNVTVLRLSSGRLMVHSMAPFSEIEMAQICAVGAPGWLVEAMLLHDTYAGEGRRCFPEIPFLGPPGFGELVGFPTAPLAPPPAEWQGEIEVLSLAGIPKLKEHLLLHIPSRTLIVADLIFNFSSAENGWDRFFHRYIAGFKRYPGMSRIFRFAVEDRAAFEASLATVMQRDFDRIIVGHGKLIESNGKALLQQALNDAGFKVGVA